MSEVRSSTPLQDSEKTTIHPPTGDAYTKGTSVGVQVHNVRLHDIDDAAAFVAGYQGEVTEEQSRRVRRKIDRHILPLMMVLYFVQFTDKTTLGHSSILGIWEANGLDQNSYK